MKNFYLFRSAAAVVLMSAAALAQAQLITQRPVTLVVPYPAGGPLDNAARILAEKVRSSLDTTVVVDNKPGAGGNIGVAGVSKAVPDGHTIVMGAVATHAVNPWLFPKMPYDALKDFTPITLVAQVPNVLVISADTSKRLGIKTTKDLIAYVQKNPGKLNYASGGNGSAGHLSGELFKGLAKLFMVHIPYAGAAPAQLSVLSGQTDLMFDNLASASANIKAGKLVALGVTTSQRSDSLPGVPSINEQLPGFEISTWFGLFAPANLPKATLDQLHKAFASAMASPDVIEKFARMSAVPSPTTPAQFDAFVRKEHDAYGKLIARASIKLE